MFSLLVKKKNQQFLKHEKNRDVFLFCAFKEKLRFKSFIFSYIVSTDGVKIGLKLQWLFCNVRIYF